MLKVGGGFHSCGELFTQTGTPAVRERLEDCRHHSLTSGTLYGNSDYFFPTSAGGPFCAWGKNKMRFDELCGVKNWTLHDVRRTVRTKLGEWGCCDDATAERILGHVSSEARISRIYNRWKYFP